MLLHEIELSSSDPQKSKEFYQEILGLNVLTENNRLKVFDSGRRGLDLNASNHYSKISLSFLVKDIGGFKIKLKQKGISYTEPFTTHLGMQEIVIEDPDGNRIAIHSPNEGSPDWLKDLL